MQQRDAARAGRAPRSLRDYLDLLLMGLSHSFSDGFTNLLVPVMPLIVVDLGITDVQVGALLSAFSLATFLFVFPTSLAADHSGRKLLVLVIGLVVASAAFFSMLAVAVFGFLVVLAFIAGAGNAVYHPCGTALTAERFPAIKPYAISFHAMMGNVGTSLIPIVLAFVAERRGWRWAIATCTFPLLVIAPLLWVRYRHVEARPPRGEAREPLLRNAVGIAASVLRNRNVLVLSLIYAISGMASKSSIGFLSLLATRRFNFPVSTVGLLMSLYFGMGIVAKPLMGFLYARLGPRLALAIPLAASCVATVVTGFVPSAAAMVASVAVVGATNPISPIILTAAVDYSEAKVLASSVGLIYSMHGLGFVGPLIGGWLAQEAGMPATYVFASALFLGTAGMTAVIARRRPAASAAA
jgi:MFS family permease